MLYLCTIQFEYTLKKVHVPFNLHEHFNKVYAKIRRSRQNFVVIKSKLGQESLSNLSRCKLMRNAYYESVRYLLIIFDFYLTGYNGIGCELPSDAA